MNGLYFCINLSLCLLYIKYHRFCGYNEGRDIILCNRVENAINSKNIQTQTYTAILNISPIAETITAPSPKPNRINPMQMIHKRLQKKK